MTARKSVLAAALALLWLGAAALPGRPAAAEAANPWRLALSPTALTVGVATNVTATVTDGTESIGCVAFYLPAGFKVVSASISSVPHASTWSARVAGAGPTWVTFSTTRDPWRLNGGEQGVFVIRVIATTGPLPAWAASAYKKFTVDHAQLVSGPLVAPGPFTMAPTHTSTPTRTPTPTARPIATPTPNRVSAAPPTVRPAGVSSPSPDPSASPSDSIAPSATPLASDSPLPDAVAAADTTAPGSGGVWSGGDGTSLDVGALPAGGTVQLDSAAVGGMGMFAWMVPGLFLSLPALLLILVLVAQGALATIFVPVTRRVLGVGHRRLPTGRPVAPG